MNIVKRMPSPTRLALLLTRSLYDRFRTLELNSRMGPIQTQCRGDVLSGEADLDRMMRDRMRAESKVVCKM
jgi:hypothetical protein